MLNEKMNQQEKKKCKILQRKDVEGNPQNKICHLYMIAMTLHAF